MAFQSKTKEIQFIRHFVATKIPEGSSTVSTGLQRTRSTKRNLISTSRAREDDNAFIPHTFTHVCHLSFTSPLPLPERLRSSRFENQRCLRSNFYSSFQINRRKIRGDTRRKGKLKFQDWTKILFGIISNLSTFSKGSFYLSFFRRTRFR